MSQASTRAATRAAPAKPPHRELTSHRRSTVLPHGARARARARASGGRSARSGGCRWWCWAPSSRSGCRWGDARRPEFRYDVGSLGFGRKVVQPAPTCARTPMLRIHGTGVRRTPRPSHNEINPSSAEPTRTWSRSALRVRHLAQRGARAANTTEVATACIHTLASGSWRAHC